VGTALPCASWAWGEYCRGDHCQHAYGSLPYDDLFSFSPLSRPSHSSSSHSPHHSLIRVGHPLSPPPLLCNHSPSGTNAMLSKRTFHQDDEESSWPRFADQEAMTPRSMSRASMSSFSSDSSRPDYISSRVASTPLGRNASSKHKRTLSGSNSTSCPHPDEMDPAFKVAPSQYRSSLSLRRHPQPRTLSEEISRAMNKPETNYLVSTLSAPKPTSSLLSSPTITPSTLPTPSTASPASTTISTEEHLSLFQPSSKSQQESTPGSEGQQKPRPSPLSLQTSNLVQRAATPQTTTTVAAAEEVAAVSAGEDKGESVSPSFSKGSGSLIPALNCDSTTPTDVAGSPQKASPIVDTSLEMPLPTFSLFNGRRSRESASSASTSSSYHSGTCSSGCHQNQRHKTPSSHHHHHPSCPHSQPQHRHHHHHYHRHHHSTRERNNDNQAKSMLPHAHKPERATKGVRRFGLPQFCPQMDDSYSGSSEQLSEALTTETSGSGYDAQKLGHEGDDDSDPDVYEPPMKRQRSATSMLIDAALETVIFTGAVALTAYQLLTGKGQHDDTPSSSPPLSPLPAFEEGEDCSQEKESVNAQDDDEDLTEKILSLVSARGQDHPCVMCGACASMSTTCLWWTFWKQHSRSYFSAIRNWTRRQPPRRLVCRVPPTRLTGVRTTEPRLHARIGHDSPM